MFGLSNVQNAAINILPISRAPLCPSTFPHSGESIRESVLWLDSLSNIPSARKPPYRHFFQSEKQHQRCQFIFKVFKASVLWLVHYLYLSSFGGRALHKTNCDFKHEQCRLSSPLPVYQHLQTPTI